MKTSIDWFAEQYNLVGTAEYEQAKEMFKQQVIRAFETGDFENTEVYTAEQYYNETI